MEQKTVGVERSYSVDFLRILATTLIVLHHYQQFTAAQFEYINFWGSDIFYFGWMVEFFFLLSRYFTYKYVEKIYGGKIQRLYCEESC